MNTGFAITNCFASLVKRKDDDLLTIEEVSQRTGSPISFLKEETSRGTLSGSFKQGKWRYSENDVQKWMSECTTSGGSQGAPSPFNWSQFHKAFQVARNNAKHYPDVISEVRVVNMPINTIKTLSRWHNTVLVEPTEENPYWSTELRFSRLTTLIARSEEVDVAKSNDFKPQLNETSKDYAHC